MRYNVVKNAERIVDSSEYLIKNPNNYKTQWKEVFGNNNKICLELGMGRGSFIIEMAKKHPNINFIGLELDINQTATAIKNVEKEKITNLKMICADANEIPNMFGKEIDTIYLTFSEPWPKEKDAKKCKCIKGLCKNNANAKQKKYRSNAKLKKLYAKRCKLNQIKLNEIKLNKMKSIYPSDHKPVEIEETKMDEMEEMEFERIIKNCELHVLDPSLNLEITEILREMYLNSKTRKKTLELNSKKIMYALKQFAIANTKSRIQKPKAYFKKCVITATEQTELSTQYDVDTIYRIENEVGYE